MSISTWMRQKWQKVSNQRTWLGGLIFILLLAVGVQGYFIYELSYEMKNFKSADSSSQSEFQEKLVSVND
ncbi:MAG: hypothetical protein HQL68_04145 [Magnetococcales bacterium]|nr:hypothetical protein [Magnetococcales bacterium]